MMELFDTIDWMTSIDYRKRFMAEYAQLRIRYERLRDMIRRYNDGILEFEPVSIDHLKRQADVMSEYLSILEERAVLEEVDLGQI